MDCVVGLFRWLEVSLIVFPTMRKGKYHFVMPKSMLSSASSALDQTSYAMIEDDTFAQKLLRPWSFVSQVEEKSKIVASEFPTYAQIEISEEIQSLPRRRRNDLGVWAKYADPDRKESCFDGHTTAGGKGWWNRQMLVDRSLRSMAALTTLLAIIMISLCAAYMSDFVKRTNKNSTSVGSKKPQSCKSLEAKNIVYSSISFPRLMY